MARREQAGPDLAGGLKAVEQFFDDHFTEFLIGALLLGAVVMILIAVTWGD
jgi:hypothetical protein